MGCAEAEESEPTQETGDEDLEGAVTASRSPPGSKEPQGNTGEGEERGRGQRRRRKGGKEGERRCRKKKKGEGKKKQLGKLVFKVKSGKHRGGSSGEGQEGRFDMKEKQWVGKRGQ